MMEFGLSGSGREVQTNETFRFPCRMMDYLLISDLLLDKAGTQ
jgi:hypothetical protein